MLKKPVQMPILRHRSYTVPVTHRERDRYGLRGLRQSLERFAGEVWVDSLWLEMPMAGDWICAYRIGSSGRGRKRKTVILEVRIFPHEVGHEAGEWSARLLGDAVEHPRAAFSFAHVRDVLKERAQSLPPIRPVAFTPADATSTARSANSISTSPRCGLCTSWPARCPRRH